MNLLVDIGNSAVKWALAKGLRFERSGRFPRAGDSGVQMDMAWGGQSVPDRIVVSNVAGAAAAQQLSAWLARTWQVQPRYIRASRQAAGVTSAYTQPEQLGTDRWAAMIAAWQAAHAAVCVVDCGTAITIDLVDAAGMHRGGQIVAGLSMMRQALGTRTAELPVAEGSDPPVLLATCTADAISSGTLYAAAAAIERIVAGMAAATRLQPALVITGGDAPRLAPLLQLAATQDADLVLKGIAILAGER